MSKQPKKAPVLSARHALICLITVLIGAGVGRLLYLATDSVPLAIIAGGAAFTKVWLFLDAIID